ncbi:MAG: Methionyl-tRNA formyltransferase [Parcubacteria group bacterium GW2011_GWA2_47_21]|nr:MAG: Methionyl-tRNA formyltransferase [Parcubacteria group bacterium GW2011_GWA2_47_21]
MDKISQIRFVFFGTGDFAVGILDVLEQAGLLPNLIITTPDAPKGRGLKMTPSPVKEWAGKKDTPTISPRKLDSTLNNRLRAADSAIFIVADYGKIIPKPILEIPPRGALNVHPSLLPKYRGPSPIEAQILAGEKEIGVSIMLLDEEMDHGPIIGSEKLKAPNEKLEDAPRAAELENALADMGGRLLASIIPKWLAGEIKPAEQEHKRATYTKKLEKTDFLIDLNDKPEKNFLKIRAAGRAFEPFFFTEGRGKKIRVLIKEATLKDGELKILRVVPEGKKEMNYNDFLRGL